MSVISNFPRGRLFVDIPEGLPEPGREGGLEAYTWAEISAVSAADLGEYYWDIGDTHSVTLQGTMGTLSLDTTLYAYIIGFNHNWLLEGKGITFGTFKTEDGIDVALVDSAYGEDCLLDGTKYFTSNHRDVYQSYPDWTSCEMRYDILGSTDLAPINYGTTAPSRTGRDGSLGTATKPVADTLMSCLPEDMRAVMKPIVKYTDEYLKSGKYVYRHPRNLTLSGSEEYTSKRHTDYLPLLSLFELFGMTTQVSSVDDDGFINYSWNERLYQEQYAYYRAGNSRRKYRHSDTTLTANWLTRSVAPGFVRSKKTLALISTAGSYYTNSSPYDTNNFSSNLKSYGIAPIFKI